MIPEFSNLFGSTGQYTGRYRIVKGKRYENSLFLLYDTALRHKKNSSIWSFFDWQMEII